MLFSSDLLHPRTSSHSSCKKDIIPDDCIFIIPSSTTTVMLHVPLCGVVRTFFKTTFGDHSMEQF